VCSQAGSDGRVKAWVDTTRSRLECRRRDTDGCNAEPVLGLSTDFVQGVVAGPNVVVDVQVRLRGGSSSMCSSSAPTMKVLRGNRHLRFAAVDKDDRR
jgi:hypothetical protein